MRWWMRSLGVGALVGLAVGFVVGGALGRIFMRLVFLAREDALGLETAMGAIVGDLTAGGTLFIGVFGAFVGVALGIAYVVVRPLLSSRLLWRELVFVAGVSAMLLRLIVDENLDDFAFLPVTISLVLVLGSVALTALPVPILVERFAPDRERRPGPVAHAVVGVGLVAVTISAVLAAASAYAIEPLF